MDLEVFLIHCSRLVFGITVIVLGPFGCQVGAGLSNRRQDVSSVSGFVLF